MATAVWVGQPQCTMLALRRRCGSDTRAGNCCSNTNRYAWVAARCTLPGIVAHESARQGGVRLRRPDFGDAPET
ncbi:hypothetical protein ACFQMH_39125 [Streptomyces viridiviolaceus]|uniref:Uncharacterized protein n=1 Tax=Streptomyces viridiviolaceus TaxID=68282 RepID=A0ABW2EFR2_9ACTN|nr:hypothetical protein [Streptomyces viridiviolaceus]